MTEAGKIHCRRVLTPTGWLHDAVLDCDAAGMIVGIEPASAGVADLDTVIPGMPNLHSHAFQRAMAGLAGNRSDDQKSTQDSFWTWREAMYRMAQRITPEQLEAVAAWLQIEMLRSGFTSCAEFHYLHHAPGGQTYSDLSQLSQRIMSSARQSGIGLTLLPVLYCNSGFNKTGVNEHQRRFANSPDRFIALFESCVEHARSEPRITVGMAPHSLRAVNEDQLRYVLEAIGRADCPIHIHIAEQEAEVEQAESCLGARPVAWLLNSVPVDHRWCLVHATHMNAEEIKGAAASGAVAGLCPITEADLGDGLFSIEAWLDHAGRWGVGSDSNLQVSSVGELRLLEFGARLTSGRRNILAREGLSCGRFAWQNAAAGGGQAMGQAVGQISAGFYADLVELDCMHPLLQGVEADQALNSFVMAGDDSMIRSVWVSGTQRIKRGQHAKQRSLENAFSTALKELRND